MHLSDQIYGYKHDTVLCIYKSDIIFDQQNHKCIFLNRVNKEKNK